MGSRDCWTKWTPKRKYFVVWLIRGLIEWILDNCGVKNTPYLIQLKPFVNTVSSYEICGSKLWELQLLLVVPWSCKEVAQEESFVRWEELSCDCLATTHQWVAARPLCVVPWPQIHHRYIGRRLINGRDLFLLVYLYEPNSHLAAINLAAPLLKLNWNDDTSWTSLGLHFYPTGKTPRRQDIYRSWWLSKTLNVLDIFTFGMV